MAFSKATDLLKLASIAASRHQGISLSEIEEEFGCTRRTAQRMTEAFEIVFPDVETITDVERRKYWRLRDQRLSRLLRVTPNELSALKIAETAANRDHDTETSTQLATLHDKILALLPRGDVVRVEADEEALLEAHGFAARPGPKAVTKEGIHSPIVEALTGPFLLSITYQNRTNPSGAIRAVAPYGVLYGPRRYLVAKNADDLDGPMRHFRMDRIGTAEVLPESFERDPNFNLDRHARQAFGLYQNEEQHGEVVWKFEAKSADNARDFEFHPDQELEDQPDGSVIVRFEASGWLEMCWHLYMWGDAVEVLHPPGLASLVEGHRRSDFDGLP
jgi:predicted DNA-binding transcriptional regulator YafY